MAASLHPTGSCCCCCCGSRITAPWRGKRDKGEQQPSRWPCASAVLESGQRGLEGTQLVQPRHKSAIFRIPGKKSLCFPIIPENPSSPPVGEPTGADRSWNPGFSGATRGFGEVLVCCRSQEAVREGRGAEVYTETGSKFTAEALQLAAQKERVRHIAANDQSGLFYALCTYDTLCTHCEKNVNITGSDF